MTVPIEEQIEHLFAVIVELQRSLMQQQRSLNKMTKVHSNTLDMLQDIARKGYQNDRALLTRLKRAEKALQGVMHRERTSLLSRVGKPDLD